MLEWKLYLYIERCIPVLSLMCPEVPTSFPRLSRFLPGKCEQAQDMEESTVLAMSRTKMR
jgi:hypothetical protein